MRNRSLRLFREDSSFLLNVGDYAEEIEKAVGPEIYLPIFQAGLFLIFSGVIAATVVAVILSNPENMAAIVEDFEEAKKSQIKDLDIDSKIKPVIENKVSNELISSIAVNELEDLDL
jgi:hypothetical protein